MKGFQILSSSTSWAKWIAATQATTASTTIQYLIDATVTSGGPCAWNRPLRFAKKPQPFWLKRSSSWRTCLHLTRCLKTTSSRCSKAAGHRSSSWVWPKSMWTLRWRTHLPIACWKRFSLTVRTVLGWSGSSPPWLGSVNSSPASKSSGVWIWVQRSTHTSKGLRYLIQVRYHQMLSLCSLQCIFILCWQNTLHFVFLTHLISFHPTDVPDLKAALFVESLQQEAQHALSEVVQLLYPGDQERFARILLTASMLQSITPSLISELFFRPVIGQADLLELLVDMLFFR